MISIIVPVYNVEKYLDKCITSLQNQTYQDVEILLIDDGSTDKSGDICEHYAEQDSRIIVYHKENGGLSDARNYGIQKAKGQYVAFVDSDDYVHHQMFDILLQNMEGQQADIVACKYKKVFEDDDNEIKDIVDYRVYSYTSTEAVKNVDKIGITAWNKLYKKELFKNIKFEVGRLHEDEFIFHRIVYVSRKVVAIDSALYYYVQRKGSIMNSISAKNIRDAIAAYHDRLQFIEEHKWYVIKDDTIKEYMYYLIKKYDYIKHHSIDEHHYWKKKIVQEARELQKEMDNDSLRNEFKIFIKYPWFYRTYCHLGQIKKSLKQK